MYPERRAAIENGCNRGKRKTEQTSASRPLTSNFPTNPLHMADLDDERVGAPPLRPPLANTSSPSDKEPDDLEKIRKWQEERIARKLRGEYESSVMHLTELVRVFSYHRWLLRNFNLFSCLQIQNSSSTPLRIASVRIEGADHTRGSFLGSIVRHHMGDPYSYDESTLQAVLLTARNIGHTLQETDLFHYANVTVEPTRDVTAPVHDVDLVFQTKEKGRLQLKTSTEFGNQEGSAVCGVSYDCIGLSYLSSSERGGPPAQCLWRRRGVRRPTVFWHTNQKVFPCCVDSSTQSYTLSTRCTIDFRDGT